MGAAMAPRLLGPGRTLTVWNRSAARAAPLVAAGASLAETPAALAAQAAVIVVVSRDGTNLVGGEVVGELPKLLLFRREFEVDHLRVLLGKAS